MGKLDRLIKHVGCPGVAVEDAERLWDDSMLLIIGTHPACHHLMTNVIVDGVIRCLGEFEIILLNNIVLGGMCNERSIIVDDEFLRHAPPIEVDEATVTKIPAIPTSVSNLDIDGVVLRI